MADVVAVTATDPAFTEAAARALRGIRPTTFLRGAGFNHVDAMLARAPYRRVFAEGAQTFKDQSGRNCLVYNAYSGVLLREMVSAWPTSVDYEVERYKGPAFPNGDDQLVIRISGPNNLQVSVHRPYVYIIRLTGLVTP